MHDPRRTLQLKKERRPMAVCDARVDGGRADALVAEVILDELQTHPRIEQMSGDRMPERVAGEVPRQTGPVAVPREARLDLPLLERSRAAGEEGPLGRRRRSVEIVPKQHPCGLEERPPAPGAALQAPE